MSDSQRFLALLVLLSAVAVAVRALSHRIRVPYAVALAAAGIVVGLIPGTSGRTLVSPDLILLVFVPGLVFEATLLLDVEEVKRALLTISALATVGVAVSVVGIGLMSHALLNLAWSDALLLGAILAPTDPIAVASVLRGIAAPGRVAAVLEGESLFNDGTGVAVFAALLASVSAGSLNAGDVAVRLLLTVAAGMAIGGVCGAVTAAVLRSINEPQIETLATLTLAYGSYLAADLLHVSGIVAVVTAGLVVVSTGRRVRLHSDALLDIWRLVGFLLNAMLFLLIGSALPTRDVADLAGEVLSVFGIMVVARAVPVYGILAIASNTRFRRTAGAPTRLSWGWRHLSVVGGLRGALSVALALSVAGRPGVNPSVPILGYGAAVLTLLVQGVVIQPLAAHAASICAARADNDDPRPSAPRTADQ